MKELPASELRQVIGARLRLARTAAGFEKARHLADAIGIAENTLTTWERGRSYPDPHALILIRSLLGVPIDFFYTGALDGVPYALARKIQELADADGTLIRRTA